MNSDKYFFINADALALPFKDESVDSVVISGGIHHIPSRQKLFDEVARVLKPTGRFYWREPVSDFLPWKWIRAIIYRLSPALDHKNECPLAYDETVPLLKKSGLLLEKWNTYGFIGFCLFMNSDVLIFNKAFKFVPGIRKIVNFFIALDRLFLSLPFARHWGLQVVGVAKKNT